jgi:hypothetical protein
MESRERRKREKGELYVCREDTRMKSEVHGGKTVKMGEGRDALQILHA